MNKKGVKRKAVKRAKKIVDKTSKKEYSRKSAMNDSDVAGIKNDFGENAEIKKIEKEERKLEHRIQGVEDLISERGFSEMVSATAPAPILRRIENIGENFEGVVFQKQEKERDAKAVDYVSKSESNYATPISGRKREEIKYAGNSPNYILKPEENEDRNFLMEPEFNVRTERKKDDGDILGIDKKGRKYLAEGDYKG